MEGFPSAKFPYLRFQGGTPPKEEWPGHLSFANKWVGFRRSFVPSSWKYYFRGVAKVGLSGGDALGLWYSHSRVGEEASPYVLFLHGGGYSGLTWSTLVDQLSRHVSADYGCLDLRGHGESKCKDEENLGLERMTKDVLEVVSWLSEPHPEIEGFQGLSGKRPLILVGHSMGGALAVNVALELEYRKEVNVGGLVVLDVVEGTAISALPQMQVVLRNRPQDFPSIPDAIKWCCQSGQTKSLESACISMLGQLKHKDSSRLATQFVSLNDQYESQTHEVSNFPPESRIWEGKEPVPADGQPKHFTWRIDLSKTEPYWRGWFEGLSKKFLAVLCPKLLILAGTDRLDTELMKGHMQGKFQQQIFPRVGHGIHEDLPDKVAERMASFLVRNRYTTAKGYLPPTYPGC